MFHLCLYLENITEHDNLPSSIGNMLMNRDQQYGKRTN